jgi:hypothetical protein
LWKSTSNTWCTSIRVTGWPSATLIIHHTWKWTKKLLFHVLDLTILNSYILLIDEHWVQAFTVPVHLSLIDRPFVPHNLISTQYSPVPLTNFQMAPRLKILIAPGSKKETQIYSYYPFLSKVPASESPPGSPVGPLWREMPVFKAFLRISSRGPPH